MNGQTCALTLDPSIASMRPLKSKRPEPRLAFRTGRPLRRLSPGLRIPVQPWRLPRIGARAGRGSDPPSGPWLHQQPDVAHAGGPTAERAGRAGPLCASELPLYAFAQWLHAALCWIAGVGGASTFALPLAQSIAGGSWCDASAPVGSTSVPAATARIVSRLFIEPPKVDCSRRYEVKPDPVWVGAQQRPRRRLDVERKPLQHRSTRAKRSFAPS